VAKSKRTELNLRQVSGLVKRVKGCSLSEQDKETLVQILNDSVSFQKALTEKNMSIKKLQALVFGAKSEKSSKILKKKKGTRDKNKDKPKGHGKNGAKDFPNADKIVHPHTILVAGQRCPGCDRGNLNKYPSGTVLRIKGREPIFAEIHQLEKLRCSCCGEIYSATLPEEENGGRNDATANAMVALLKYGCGFPFYRLEFFQQILKTPLPDATQWDMVETLSRPARLIYKVLLNIAAQSKLILLDDTTMKVLSLMNISPEEKERGKEKRTGIFTTGMIAKSDNHEIALFFTGTNHAGENFAELLQKRDPKLEKLIQMSDALSRNNPKGFEVILALCLIHARRYFVDCHSAFPKECSFIIDQIALVYKNEKICKQQGMDPDKRLAFHQENSQSIMDGIKEYAESKMASKEVEPNGILGQAFNYMIDHWKGLTRFLEIPGVPLDNNSAEQLLKKIILLRKNSYFFKNENGAAVGDIFMSVIQTTIRAGENPYDYLVAIQKNSTHVVQNPQKWLPWNYKESIKILQKSKVA